MREMAKQLTRRLRTATLACAVVYAAALGLTLSPALDSIAAGQAVRPPENAVTNAPTPRDVDISRYKQTWDQVRRGVVGHVAIPDKREGVLVQASGQVWRGLHTRTVVQWGGWAIMLVVLALGAFYVWRGSIKIEHGKSNRLIERFNALERFAHWLTAACFILLAVTGLNILFGRVLFLKKPGEISVGADFSPSQDFYAWLSYWGKIIHDYAAWGFMAGLILIFVLWVGENLPDKHDLNWFAKAGGLFSTGVHPPSKKFNGGQKLLFWVVVLFGASLSFSGLCLLFPFQILPWNSTFAALNAIGFSLPTDLLPVQEMQLSQLWHAVVALVLIAIIIAHIYIGTLGMEGAFDAMGTGMVDENWAREHHSLWAEEVAGKDKEAGTKGGHAQPAE